MYTSRYAEPQKVKMMTQPIEEAALAIGLKVDAVACTPLRTASVSSGHHQLVGSIAAGANGGGGGGGRVFRSRTNVYDQGARPVGSRWRLV